MVLKRMIPRLKLSYSSSFTCIGLKGGRRHTIYMLAMPFEVYFACLLAEDPFCEIFNAFQNRTSCQHLLSIP